MYDMLDERNYTVIISFKKPTYDDHINFLKNHPYIAWYLIEDDGVLVGNIYLSDRYEWGQFIKKEYIGMGYGPRSIQELMKLHPAKYYYANVNPMNIHAIHNLREKYKGELIQHTYKVECEKVLSLEL